MAPSLHANNVKIKITESVCGFVAICMTIARLWQRRGRYWWDDACAFLSLLCVFVQIASAFMHIDNPESMSRTSKIASYYLMALSFYAIIWSARLSILFSIIRIDPDPRSRHRLYYVVVLFICAIMFFFAQLFWVCEPEGHIWKNLPSPQCHLNLEVAICQLVSDVIADSLLIFLPIRLVRGMTDKALKRRLYFIFSTAIVTTIVSLVHAAYILTEGTVNVLISAIVEDCMSLTVANVPVVATVLLRKINATSDEGGRPTEDDSREGTHWSSFRFRSQFPGVSTFGTRKAGTTATANVTSRWGGISTRGHGTRGFITTVQMTASSSSNDSKGANRTFGGNESDYKPDSITSSGGTVDAAQHFISMSSLKEVEADARLVHGPATSIAR